MSLNERLAVARKNVEALEDELAVAYAGPLRAAARSAGSRFRAVALVAATNPKWTPPTPGELVDGQTLAADGNAKARPIHERALHAVADAAVGVSFDVTNPYAVALLDGLAGRNAQILAGFGDELQATIRDAYEQGLSVADTAKLIQARAEAASNVTAQLLARTDLNSIANGGSLLMAQLVDATSADAGEPGVGGKTWITAGDERVRDTHAEADGQTVPLDQPFDVGGEQLMYPGDPQASLEETANCRCAIIYGGNAETASAVRRPTLALSSRGTMSESREDTLVAAATGSTSLKLSGRDEAWDAGAAQKSLDPADFSKAHFWRDPDKPADEIGSYKLPFAKRTDSGLVAVWRGVTAGAQRLSSTQIPAADKKAVQGKMGAYYRKAAKEYDDDTIKTPWSSRLHDFHLTAAAGEPTRWQATLLVEDDPTEDGRMIQAGATVWRALPLPLGFLDETQHGYEGSAPVIGRIDQIWRAGNLIQAAGVFNDVADTFAAECVQKIRDRMISGISVDPVGGDCEIVVTQREPDGYAEEQQDREEMQGIVDEPIVEVYDDDLEFLMVYTELVIGGATVCPQQAVAQARIELVADGETGGEMLLPIGRELSVTACEIDASDSPASAFRAATDGLRHGFETLAAAARPEPPAPVDLEPLSALVASLDARVAATETATAEELQRVASEIRGLRETERKAGLLASAQITDAVESLAASFADKLDALLEGQREIREAQTRKPREVRFNRDKNGRLAGLVEE